MKKHFLQVEMADGEYQYLVGWDVHGQLLITTDKFIAADNQKFWRRESHLAIFRQKYPDEKFRAEP